MQYLFLSRAMVTWAWRAVGRGGAASWISGKQSPVFQI